MKVFEKIVLELAERANQFKTSQDLAKFKNQSAKKYQIEIPSNIQLFKAYHRLVWQKKLKKSETIEKILKKRPVRSLSGIVNVSVLTKPFQCPGKCVYCPFVADLPKSYLPKEPAVDRAVKLGFDPFQQTEYRIQTLASEGHSTDKIDLRIIGGTWSFYPARYQTWFVKRCFDAANQKTSRSLAQAQKFNEKAKQRIIGISIETRPDFINQQEVKRLRKLGITRVELGVQSIYDEVLIKNNRGHLVGATIKATKLLKDAGFKICYQMMPNLMGSDLKKDEQMFKELFSNPDFQPDYLKIYPCLVLKEARLYESWKKGEHQAYSDRQLKNLIKKIKKRIPAYVRIQRIIRDIPAEYIVAGGKISNLRQVIHQEMKKEGWQCQCVRCREVGKDYNPKEKAYLFRQDYSGSGGKEIFLSFENKPRTKLFSFLRLRIPSQVFSNKKHFLPALEDSAVIREVQTVGQATGIGAIKLSPQHRGLGKKLIAEAEKICQKEFGLNRISVIAGIGAREYFRKLGYRLNQTYLVKNF
ncbi:MAG: tRNA uridine(34) 5-carboxymethylaminomethyl modification radical SAM/GNAT enzyme Elp3 [Patescibacteria group bacterium]